MLDKNKSMWKDDHPHQGNIYSNNMYHVFNSTFLLYYIAAAYENWNCYSSLVTQVLMDLWRGRRMTTRTMNFMTRWMPGHFSLINLFHWQDWIASCAPQGSLALNLDDILRDHHRLNCLSKQHRPIAGNTRKNANNVDITEPNISIAITVCCILSDTCNSIK